MFYEICCIIYCVFICAQFAINRLSADQDGTLFVNSTGDVSDKYFVEITPAGWTFSIWFVIYIWQAAWAIYALVNICRRGPKGKAYENPMFIPISLFIICIIITFFNVGWLITFNREEIEAACACLLAYSVLKWLALFISYRALDKALPELVEQGRTKEIWLTRALFHNGIAIQATWVTIASLINVATVLAYAGDKIVGYKTSSTIALGILAFLIILFASSDLLLLDRYTRYTITPYLVVVVALIGSLSENYEEGATNTIISIVLLSIGSVLLVAKIIVTVYRHFKRQRYRAHVHYGATIGGHELQGRMA